MELHHRAVDSVVVQVIFRQALSSFLPWPAAMTDGAFVGPKTGILPTRADALVFDFLRITALRRRILRYAEQVLVMYHEFVVIRSGPCSPELGLPYFK